MNKKSLSERDICSKFITPAARSFCHRKARQQVAVSFEDPRTMIFATVPGGNLCPPPAMSAPAVVVSAPLDGDYIE